MAKKRGLGRGLDALLGGVNNPTTDAAEPASEGLEQAAADAYPELSVHKVQRGRYQPRRDIEPEALEELAESIRAHGVMQPIVVRPIEDARYEIIAGERRWRAAQMAGLEVIPAVVKDVPDEAAIAMALIENIQRENLNPMEEAIALQRLQSEFELTQQQVADAVGKSRSAIANLLRLIKLTPDVRKMLEYGDIEMGHARALLALDGALQVEAAQEVTGKALSVRQAEELVRRIQAGEQPPQQAKPALQNPALSQIASDLSRHLATKVAINQNAKGKGKITINFDSEELRDSILNLLK